jgi:NADPH-dependent 2,4-dienoyl-CoA reductase/sulfur reductase-like enzyme/rhodanese-related sulfurtransferase
MNGGKRILIVGGVAGGASCAARVRRNCETSEIVLFDRGPYVSFANCGLPYYVGNVILEEKSLLVATPELFRDRFNIIVKTEHEVRAIDRAAREIEVCDLKTGTIVREKYDELVLSPGAAPIRPPLPGIDLPGIFALRTIPDSRRIRAWLTDRAVKSALVVGGGFIGLEMAENLQRRGLAVTVVELADQLMPPLDPEMSVPVRERMLAAGVRVMLGDAVESFAAAGDGLAVKTKSGTTLEAGIVILAIGVRPEVTLAKAAGLEIGPRGGIRVDDRMRTSDPHIWAVGDAIEVVDTITGSPLAVPLAGPANRQGRVAADNLCERDAKFRGVQATAVCGAFGLTIAMTGASEKSLKRAGITDYEKVWLHPGHHVGYYPGSHPIHLKLVFRKTDGRVLGAQAVGEEGVEKRIDVIAMAVQMKATVFDLEEAELCYAPQFGAAKDPVNIGGMIAANHVRGDLPLASWDDLAARVAGGACLIDVREPGEYETGSIPGAVNIPLSQMRRRMGELPRGREILVFCQVGQRGYYAVRALRAHGYQAANLPGGLRTWGMMRRDERAADLPGNVR